jgi:hypothetical protein
VDVARHRLGRAADGRCRARRRERALRARPGYWSDTDPGTPADRNTGELLTWSAKGTPVVLASGLDRPTSVEPIGDDAYVVTLGGEVWKVDGANR